MNEMLRQKIEESGLKVVAIAEKMGITASSLYNKINGKTEFLASEIVALTDILRLTEEERDDIFLS